MVNVSDYRVKLKAKLDALVEARKNKQGETIR